MNEPYWIGIGVVTVLLVFTMLPRMKNWWNRRRLRKEEEQRKKQKISRWAGDGFLD